MKPSKPLAGQLELPFGEQHQAEEPESELADATGKGKTQ